MTDNPEWTEGDFAKARPASEVIGKEVAAQLVRKTSRSLNDQTNPDYQKRELALVERLEALDADEGSAD